MTSIPDDSPIYYGCKELAARFNALNFKISPATLETMRSRGGGPPAVKFGKHVVYEWSAALAWVKGRLRPYGVTLSNVAFQNRDKAEPAPKPITPAREKVIVDDKKAIAGWEAENQVTDPFAKSRFEDAKSLSRKPGDDRISNIPNVRKVALAIGKAA